MKAKPELGKHMQGFDGMQVYVRPGWAGRDLSKRVLHWTGSFGVNGAVQGTAGADLEGAEPKEARKGSAGEAGAGGAGSSASGKRL